MNEETQYMPMPSSKAVTAGEIEEGEYTFKIVSHNVEERTGKFPLFHVNARPLDVKLDPEKTMSVSRSWAIKKGTGCGDFIRSFGVEPEVSAGGVLLPGLVGSCFMADVKHVMDEKTGMMYANIVRDSARAGDCKKQDRLD